MRLDKFLKITALVKRRTIANLLCDEEHVIVNGLPAKASREVNIGDHITICFPNRAIMLEVTAIPTNKIRQNEMQNNYTIVNLIKYTEHLQQPDNPANF